MSVSIRRLALDALVLLGLAFEVGAAAPRIDASFAEQGTAAVFGNLPAGAIPNASAMQTDGRLLVALSFTGGRPMSEGLMRLTTTGQPDPSFGQGGYVPFSRCCALLETLRDGSIFVVDLDSRLWHFDPNGRPVQSFGSNGAVQLAALDFPMAVKGLIEQADGGALVVRSGTSGGAFRLHLSWFRADGAADLRFGDGGVLSLLGLPPNFRLVALRPDLDGGFFALATATFDGGTYLVMRVKRDGHLAPEFGSGGLVSGFAVGHPAQSAAGFVRLQDGSLVIHGDRRSSGVLGSVVWKLRPDGSRDQSFGQGGESLLLHDRPKAVATAAGIGFQSNHDGQSLRFSMLDFGGGLASQFGVAGSTILRFPSGVYPEYFGSPVMPLFAAPDGGLALVLNAPTLAGNDRALGHAYAISLDATGRPRQGFGRGGAALLDALSLRSQDIFDAIRAVPGGGLLLAGKQTSPWVVDAKYLISRLGEDGQIDGAFGDQGSGGVTTSDNGSSWDIDVPGGAGRVVGNNLSDSRPVALAQQDLDTIAVVKAGVMGSTVQTPFVDAFRYSGQGRWLAPFAPSLSASSSAWQIGLAADARAGLLYGAGGSTEGGWFGFLERRLVDGTPDPLYGASGKVVLPVPVPPGAAEVAALGDGSAFVAFLCADALRIFKLDARGRVVNGFGERGVFQSPLAPAALSSTPRVFLFPAPNGGVVAAASAGRDGAHFMVWRVSADGRIEQALDLFPDQTSPKGPIAALLRDGSLLIARDAGLWRLQIDGRFDASFGPGGQFGIDGIQAVTALAVDNSGRVVLAGIDLSGTAVVKRYLVDVQALPVAVIEFHNPPLNHYFITGGLAEIQMIEHGGAGPGWQRTGQSFKAYAPESGVPVGALPVCRFYGTPGLGPNSHFYTVDPIECELVKRDRGWTYEGTAFYVFPPANDQCAAGQQSVYRAYNQRFAQNDSNHRYTADTAVYAQMQTQGWAGEGVVFCGAR